MLAYVTKSRYWDIIDRGIMEGIQGTSEWHLKDIQDAVAYSYLHDKLGFDIAEIGAGNSRLLPALTSSNRCYAIDKYTGADGGPKSRPALEKVKFINCNIGNSVNVIDDASFDIIFSVSVVEHIPSQILPEFFSDCWRILKVKGLMIHLIDAYVEDVTGDNSELWKRVVQGYSKPFHDGIFSPTGLIEFSSLSDMAFKTTLATNPDNEMRNWNKLNPNLLEKRKVAQSCSIEMVGRRVP